MSQALVQAAPLKPEIRLAQAISEFEALLSLEQKQDVRARPGQGPPDATAVLAFTAELNEKYSQDSRGRRCLGPRFINVLECVQGFSSIVDTFMNASQLHIAGAIYGVVRVALKVRQPPMSCWASILFSIMGPLRLSLSSN